MKRKLILALCIIMAVSMLTACNSESEDASLKVLVYASGFDCNEDPFKQTLEEVTGYKVEYSNLPSEDGLVKLNTILAAQEEYDVMILEYADYEKTVGLNAYMTLNDLLDAYGKELLAGTDSSLLINTTINGEIKGIPFRTSTENYPYGFRVRTDLMNQAGIEEMPSTPDELYTALKMIKDNLGMIPLSHYGAFVDEIASAYGISNSWNICGEEIVNRAEMPALKEYVLYMNKLYSEGLLDSEWSQNTAEDCKEKFFSGKTAIYQMAWWDEPAATNTLLENDPEAEYTYLPPMKNDTGSSNMPLVRGPHFVAVIPRTCKDPENAMKWMNSKVENEDVFRRLSIGVEGVHYKVENGEYVPIQPAFSDEMGNANVYLTGTIAKDYDIYWQQTRLHKDDTLYAEFQKIQANIAGANICYDPISFMPSNEEYSKLAVSVDSYVEDTVLQMIVGARSIDEWDAFVQEYREMGGTRMNEIVNEWWTQNKESVLPLAFRSEEK